MNPLNPTALFALLLGLTSLTLASFFTLNYAVTDNELSKRIMYDGGFTDEEAAFVINNYLTALPVITPESKYILSKAHLNRAVNLGLFSDQASLDRQSAENYLLQSVAKAPGNPGAWYYLSLLEFIKAKDTEKMAGYYMMSLDISPRVPYAVFQRLYFSGIILPFVGPEERKRMIDQIYAAWEWNPEHVVAKLPPTLARELLEEALMRDKDALMQLRQNLKD